MTKALIVVDVQNDFISGSLPVPGGEQVAQRIAYQLLPHYEGYAVTTQDFHVNPGDHFTEWPEHCVAGTPGCYLHESIANISFDGKFLKGQSDAAYSGFEGRDIQGEGLSLAKWLTQHKVTEVDIVGLALDHCVKATALDAVKEGFTATVWLPYTAAVTPEGGEAAVAEMEAAGVTIVQAATL